MMDLLEKLRKPWPEDYELQPENAKQRHNVIEILDNYKQAVMLIESLTAEIAEAKIYKAEAERKEQYYKSGFYFSDLLKQCRDRNVRLANKS